MKLELPELYDYQLQSVDRLRTGIENGAHGQVLSLPTGGGKLVIARDMIAKAYLKGSQTVFLVDRHDLLEQTSRRFFEVGLPHGAISGGIDFGYHERVQIWMVQTLAARGWPMVDLDLVVIDECDRMYRFLTESLPKRTCPYIGLSATPTARGMANVYSGGVVQTATTNQLLDAGRLTPFIVRPAVEIDTNGMPLVNGEFDAGEIQVRGRRIIGDIVSSWVSETNKHFGGPVKTMLFGASVDHVAEICADFQAAGYDFRHVSGRDDRDHRNETMAAFRHGEFPGLGSVELLTRGIDIPDVLCLICARPYNRALAAYLQMLGRLMRTAPGKKVGLVIDHSGNHIGFYDEIEAFFDQGVPALDHRKFSKASRKATTAKERKEITCRGCGIVLTPRAEVCPACGMERKRARPSGVVTVPGTLISIEAVSAGKRGWKGSEAELWTACCTAAARGIKRHGDPARAARQAKAHFRDLTGRWPPRHYRYVPGDRVPRAIQRKLDQRYREWKKRQKETAR